jgi:hypothetical protein
VEFEELSGDLANHYGDNIPIHPLLPDDARPNGKY